MADVVSPQTRSRMMAGIRGRDTKPELAVRKGLHGLGFRFRLSHQSLPGRPDLYLTKYRTAIFVNGCFWHGHAGCRFFKLPTTRSEFWSRKISDNVTRDRKNVARLHDQGWRVVVVWECSLKCSREHVMQELAKFLRGNGHEFEI